MLMLTIDRIEPEIPIENRSVHIFFNLTNFSDVTTIGSVSAFLFVGAPLWQAVRSTGWLIQLDGQMTAAGVVTMILPAGKQLPLVLLYWPQSGESVQAETRVDVAARYAIGLSSYASQTIRGGTHDENHVTMTLVPGDEVAAITIHKSVGTADFNQRQDFPPELTVSNVDVVPSSEPQHTVQLTFLMVNKDTQGNIGSGLDFLNEISDLADAITSIFVPGDAMALVNQRMHAFHGSLLQGCDGVVAADRYVFPGALLARWTESVDSHSETNAYQGDNSPQIGCSGRRSLYEITYTVTRHRYPPMFETVTIMPQYVSLTPNQQFHFHIENENDFHAPKVQWSLAPGPGDQGAINQDFGEYYAPADSDWRRVFVIRATTADGRRGLAFARVLPIIEKEKVTIFRP